jgi:hypothetical protein
MIQPEIERWLTRRRDKTIRRLEAVQARIVDRRLPRPMARELRNAMREEVARFAADTREVFDALSTGDVLVNGVMLDRLDVADDELHTAHCAMRSARDGAA